MQSRIIRYFTVGFLAITLAGAGLTTNASAQWVQVGPPYRATMYPVAEIYPAYVVWRPFGGLFAGGFQRLVCLHCRLSPCCCVAPVVCDPCWTPCFDPCCDPCFTSCCTVCGTIDDCGCSSGYMNYDQPVSKTIGPLSPTGFGSVSPPDGIPGQPMTAPSFGSQQTTIRSGTLRPTNEPTVAPPQNTTTIRPEVDYYDRINIQRRDGTTYGGLNSSAADTPPTTNTMGIGSFSNPSSDNWMTTPGPEAVRPETAPAVPGGGLPYPVTIPGSEIQPGNGSSTNNRMIDLGTGLISVTVPEHSKVYINGYETKMTGTNRRFVVNDLEPGMSYNYDVRIVAQVNGQSVEESHRVTLESGQQDALVFGQPRPQLNTVNSSHIAARPVQ